MTAEQLQSMECGGRALAPSFSWARLRSQGLRQAL